MRKSGNPGRVGRAARDQRSRVATRSHGLGACRVSVSVSISNDTAALPIMTKRSWKQLFVVFDFLFLLFLGPAD